MGVVVLLLLLIAVLVVLAYLTVPSGVVVGRTALLPGQSFEFHKVRALPVLALIPTTTVRWKGHEWVFALVRFSNGVCRAYIVRQPPYDRRPMGLGSTHRLADGLGRKYVCWEPEPRTANQMSGALALWVAATCRYRETGVFLDARQAAQELDRS
jgi:hypothetical protein